MSMGLCPTRVSRAWEPRYKNVVNEIKPSQLKNCLELVDMKNTIGCLGKNAKCLLK